jgi:hypothetical protein
VRVIDNRTAVARRRNMGQFLMLRHCERSDVSAEASAKAEAIQTIGWQ